MNELALFAGAGGGILGGKLLGWRTVCAVEIDPYCREVLLRRQEDGSIGPFPVWDDVRTFDGEPWRGVVDIVTAGFPCQPFSVAGRRRGESDERNMWPETKRILSEVRPRVTLLENVPGLLSTPYWRTILGDLAELGFDAEWCVVSAAGCGAPHIRKRVWLLAHAQRLRGWRPHEHHEPRRDAVGWGKQAPREREADQQLTIQQCSTLAHAMCTREVPGEQPGRGRGVEQGGQAVAHATGDGRLARGPGGATEIQGGRQPDRDGVEGQGDIPDAGCWDGQWERPGISEEAPSSWWAVEPDMGRVANGVAYRVDRLKAIGNGQVPAVVKKAWGVFE